MSLLCVLLIDSRLRRRIEIFSIFVVGVNFWALYVFLCFLPLLFWWKSKSIWKNKASGFEMSFLKWLLGCFFVFCRLFCRAFVRFWFKCLRICFLHYCVFCVVFLFICGRFVLFWILLCRKMQFFACVMFFYYDF